MKRSAWSIKCCQTRPELDALAREELGIDPTELGGSAYEAALASFILFALGAIVPILPFLVTAGGVAVIASVGLSGSLCSRLAPRSRNLPARLFGALEADNLHSVSGLPV